MPNPDIVHYIKANRSRYTDAALRTELRSEGYSEWEIDEAFGSLPTPGADDTWSQTFSEPGFWLTYLGVLGGSVFLVVSGALPGQLLGLAGAGILVLLFFGALSGGLDQRIRRACGCALATLVVTPIVAFAGLYAYCLLNGSSIAVVLSA